jgi:RNA polymerase sigma-70 factor (ECF subfamily)
MAASIPSPDLLLARRAAAGQSEAWQQLIDQYGRKLYNVAYQFAGSLEEAEDLTQEIFLRLFRTLRQYRGDVPLVAWALRLSRNLCIDHFRRHRRERSSTAVSEKVLQHVPASDDPRADAERRQKLEAVYRALDDMPRHLAELVILQDLQGWSLKETAEYLQLPVGTVKSRLHRARNELVGRVQSTLGLADEGDPSKGGIESWRSANST